MQAHVKTPFILTMTLYILLAFGIALLRNPSWQVLAHPIPVLGWESPEFDSSKIGSNVASTSGTKSIPPSPPRWHESTSSSSSSSSKSSGHSPRRGRRGRGKKGGGGGDANGSASIDDRPFRYIDLTAHRHLLSGPPRTNSGIDRRPSPTRMPSRSFLATGHRNAVLKDAAQSVFKGATSAVKGATSLWKKFKPGKKG